jgi:hypothetical protein
MLRGRPTSTSKPINVWFLSKKTKKCVYIS